jgi:hypothetical protein
MLYHPIESEMEMFARVYSRDTGIKILFGKSFSTNGKNITIVKLLDTADPWIRFMVEMGVYHETGHIITKDYPAFKVYLENNGTKKTHKSTIFNNVRDTTIEGQTMEVKWPGMKTKWHDFLATITEKQNEAIAAGHLKTFRMLMLALYLRGRELQHGEPIGNGLVLPDTVEEIFNNRIASFLPDIAEHNTIAESQRLTEAIYEELMKEPPPPPPPPQPQPQSGGDENDKDESNDEDNSCPVPMPGDSDEEAEAPDEQMDMPNEEKEDEDEDETVSVPGDSGDEDENPDENDSEDEESTSKTPEDEEDSEDKDESEDDSKDSESNENEDESGEDENDTPDESEDGESDKSEDSEADESEDSEADESEDSEADKSEDGEGDDTPESEDGEGEDESFSDDAEKELKKTQQEMEDGDADDTSDVGEDIAKNVNKYADDTYLYREEAGLEEKIIQCHPRYGWQPEVAGYEVAGRQMTGYTGTKLKVLFISEKAPVTHRNLKSGKLDCLKLWKLKLGMTEICKQINPSSRQDSAVSMVVDHSGSMNGPRGIGQVSKGRITHSIMTSLGTDLEKMRIPFEAIGFTTQWVHDNVYANGLAETGIRTLPIEIHLMKTFQEPYRTVRHKFVWPTNTLATAELPALIFATKRLLKRKETKKVLFLLTDGGTCTGNENLDNAMHAATIDYIARMKRAGIRVVLIGILNETVKDYDPDALIFNDLETFATKFYRHLMSILL